MANSTTTTEQTSAKQDEATPKSRRPNKSNGSNGEISVEVTPRMPRLAWHGMARDEVAVSVPTQVVEIVRPGKARVAEDELPGLGAGRQAARTEDLPENRLIWTNDNLVALQTLLDERDPATRGYRYRGKIDLVYIDPPFMVNNDFLADNAVDVDLDREEGVQAKKEPSLVEILAYKDTWRQGLDSFLSMLRARLVLLRELLAPTGSIYVHLDWHAVHYVKVLMDELFGYENFVNEVIWRRAFAHSDADRCGYIHDTLLVYGMSSNRTWNTIRHEPDPQYLKTFFDCVDENTGKRYQRIPLTGPGLRHGPTGSPWRGIDPSAIGRHWAKLPEEMDRLDREGRIHWPSKGVPRLKRYEDEYEGMEVQDIWTDINKIHNQSNELLGFPTQKPVALVERVIAASSPPNGIVLDCFVGSGTTTEAAERLGRRWIAIDNGKYAVHLTRKRLIQLHQREKPGPAHYDWMECPKCKNIERKEKKTKTKETFNVRPFTVENMGVYQRAEAWQDFQTQRSRYRDEMIKVFGGEVVNHSPLLHGRKGNSWIHVGPLDGPVSVGQVWSIAREAQRTDRKRVTVLSADFDTLANSEKDEIEQATGVNVVVRAIPAQAIEEVKRRIELLRANPDVPPESMAVPAFYAPLSILLSRKASGLMASVTLERCEIDIESFLASQRPALKAITQKMTASAKKKAQKQIDKWETRQRELEKWLAKADTWQKFIDFWAVDWDYGRKVGPDEKPIFETDWQSFRVRRGKQIEPLVFTAEYRYEQPGHYRVAAKVTDVFGNDGIATVTLEVR